MQSAVSASPRIDDRAASTHLCVRRRTASRRFAALTRGRSTTNTLVAKRLSRGTIDLAKPFLELPYGWLAALFHEGTRGRGNARRVAALISGLAWSCSSEPADSPRCLGASSHHLVNARPTPSIPLTPSQAAAIGVLRTPAGEVHCSGALLSDRWVLSASHCMPPGLEHPLVFHTDIAGEDLALPALTHFAHPELDAMLFEVPTHAAVRMNVQPLAVWSAADGVPRLGQVLTLAGFGDTEDGTDGKRLFLDEPLVEVSAISLVVDGGSAGGACTGDSGGPLLATAPDQSVRIVGVLSEGSATCRGRDRYVRTDVLTDWIRAVQDLREQDACGGLSWEGSCADGRASWCAGDHLEASDCQNHELCGWDSDRLGYRCVDEAADPCRGAGPNGSCDGNTLRVCMRGTLALTDCSACGGSCVEAGNGASCR
jgi:Trypsin